MNREKVESSMIASIGYDQAKETLEVEFKKGGAVWQYTNVSAQRYHALMQSDSAGKYFLSVIKPNCPGRQV